MFEQEGERDLAVQRLGSSAHDLRCRTQFWRALLLMQISTCTRISKNKHAVNRAIIYLLNTRTICAIFLYNSMQCIDGSSILLQRYVTKDSDAKNPAFLAFVCYRKNPVKCNACAVARKIETDCFSRNVPFSSDR